MFIFQIRPRVFRIDAPASYVPSFPADAEIRFHLQPLQPFGMMAGGGRTTVRDVGASSFFNANTGVHTIESKMPLQPLEVVIEEPTRVFSLNGNVLAITETFDTFETLRQTIESVYFCLPMLLNVTFADSPTVERVDGTIGEYGFRWELSNWHMRFAITSQELQEERIVQAWQRMPLFADGSPRRRLLAALHYFHVACRLDISGETPGEFLPEMLLNLAKTLEVLFPPHGEGTSLDATRTGLRELGIENENIERDFVPAIALRNHVGVGHALIALFTSDQLKVLHEYTERAENAFRDMLDTMIQKIESGDFEIAPYELQRLPASVVQIIERLKANSP